MVGGHSQRVQELHFCMQRGEGGRVCDIHREPGPSLTPLYNSSNGIWGASNLGSLPPKKRSKAPHSDPILKGAARNLWKTSAIKFLGRSQEGGKN